MKILIAAGGTGGHISPGLAVAEKWSAEMGEVLFIGGRGKVEKELITGSGYELHKISASPIPRSFSRNLFYGLAGNIKAFFESLKILRAFSPDIVLGTGGYVSGMPVLAASLMGIPTVIHEQNSYPGLANRMLSCRADGIAVSYESSDRHFPDKSQDKIYHTGNPIRSSLTQIQRGEARAKLSVDSEAFMVVVMGGSQGSRKINQIITRAYRKLTSFEGFFAYHITGASNYQKVIDLAEKQLDQDKLDKIEFTSFCEHISYPLSAADLFIGRAGATTLAEITACGLPAVLIPYPHAAAGHQRKNADVLAQAGAAEMLKEDDLSSEKLNRMVVSLYKSPERLEKMRKASFELSQPEAGRKLYELLLKLAREAK